MTGSDEFCEVYLDGLIVPAEQVLGAVNQGWAVVNTGLASERAYVGANTVMLELLFDDLVELARHVEFPSGNAIDDPVVREAMADYSARVSGVECIARRAVDRVASGTDEPVDALIAKLAYTELNVAIHLAASGRLRPEGADVYARWQQAFLWSRALTISGGSSEIVRNVLATQLFGFPRSW
jgi:alkylation response protein AidB-like acyl-CoA dehydrogenase